MPATSSHRPRVMTLSIQPVADFRTRYCRWSPLIAAFDERYEIMFGDPGLRPGEVWRGRLRHLHPRRSTMHRRMGFSEDTFARRSGHAEEALSAREGGYDVILEVQTLFAPGLRPRPYVVYTDTTFARVREQWPAWTPIPDATADRFLELEREVARRAHTIFTMSEHARRSFVDEYDCAPDQVVNVGMGMALPPADLDQRNWQEPVALFVGLEFARKGGDDLLAVWPQVRAAVPAARLQIVGPRRTPRDLPAGVEWLGRVDDRERLAAIYRRAAVFTMPTHFDPLGFVFGEAMASGLACIASPSCGIPEVVHDGVNGRLVPAGDHGALAEALIEMLGDPDRCERLGRRAHADIVVASSWEDVVDRMAPRLELAAGRP